jgi:hypothetical protein
MAQPALDGDTLTLAFKFGFHQKRINDPKNKQIVMDILERHLGMAVGLKCITDASATPPAIPDFVASAVPDQPAPPADPSLETISNIFGGAEVLES